VPPAVFIIAGTTPFHGATEGTCALQKPIARKMANRERVILLLISIEFNGDEIF
jgi:hypothetical protein